MPSCPWLLTAILITTCSTWASDKNWNLLLSFTRSQIRGFRIFQFFFIKHQARPTKGRLTPLCVPLDSTKKKVSTRSDSSRKTISRVSTSKLTEEMSCNKRYPFLPDLYYGCNLPGNIVLRLGQSGVIWVGGSLYQFSDYLSRLLTAPLSVVYDPGHNNTSQGKKYRPIGGIRCLPWPVSLWLKTAGFSDMYSISAHTYRHRTALGMLVAYRSDWSLQQGHQSLSPTGSFHNSITLIPDTGGSTAASVRTKT